MSFITREVIYKYHSYEFK